MTAPVLSRIVGQPSAVGILDAARRRPVHAYLFAGPAGSGKRRAALAFAAALICPDGGCGECNTCRRVLQGIHPDVSVFSRTGASLDIEVVRGIVTRAQRRPVEADRQVLVVEEVHLAERAVPALLKTVEEPPAGTVFVLLADLLPDWLSTIASRCVRVPFAALSAEDLTEWLITSEGLDPDRASSVAAGAGGRLDRALLLVADPAYGERRELWRSVPGRLDGTGARVAELVAEVMAAVEGSLDPLRALHEEEAAELARRVEATGVTRGSGRKELEERQHREVRRYRTDELRSGLAVLSETYRDWLVDRDLSGHHGHRVIVAVERAVTACVETSRALVRNPNETLLLQSLFVRLSAPEVLSSAIGSLAPAR